LGGFLLFDTDGSVREILLIGDTDLFDTDGSVGEILLIGDTDFRYRWIGGGRYY
jgi:hypothetical protein